MQPGVMGLARVELLLAAASGSAGVLQAVQHHLHKLVGKVRDTSFSSSTVSAVPDTQPACLLHVDAAGAAACLAGACLPSKEPRQECSQASVLCLA